MEENNKPFKIEQEAFNIRLLFEANREKIVFELYYEGNLLYKETPFRIDNCTSGILDCYSGDDRIRHIVRVTNDILSLKSKIIEESNISVLYKEDTSYIQTNDIWFNTKMLIIFLDKVISIFNELFSKNQVNINSSSSDITVLNELEKAGQIKLKDGKYELNTKSVMDFLSWCYNNNYIFKDKGKDNTDYVTPKLIYDHINTKCSLETLKRYFRDVKKDAN